MLSRPRSDWRWNIWVNVLNVVARLNAEPVPDSVETALALKEPPLANTSRYDSLRDVVEAAPAAKEVDHAL